METLKERFKNNNIILGSASPRRQNMLKDLGINFNVELPNNNEEIYPKDLYAEDIAKYLAKQKADNFRELKSHEILITADTIVWIDNKVLGKPKNYSDAYQMLKLLSGKKHRVISGVCIKSNTKTIVFDASTDVEFTSLLDEEIRYYIDNYKPYDKAGAYGIQEWIGLVGIQNITGSFYNVVGLPIQKLYKHLSVF